MLFYSNFYFDSSSKFCRQEIIFCDFISILNSNIYRPFLLFRVLHSKNEYQGKPGFFLPNLLEASIISIIILNQDMEDENIRNIGPKLAVFNHEKLGILFHGKSKHEFISNFVECLKVYCLIYTFSKIFRMN